MKNKDLLTEIDRYHFDDSASVQSYDPIDFDRKLAQFSDAHKKHNWEVLERYEHSLHSYMTIYPIVAMFFIFVAFCVAESFSFRLWLPLLAIAFFVLYLIVSMMLRMHENKSHLQQMRMTNYSLFKTEIKGNLQKYQIESRNENPKIGACGLAKTYMLSLLARELLAANASTGGRIITTQAKVKSVWNLVWFGLVLASLMPFLLILGKNVAFINPEFALPPMRIALLSAISGAAGFALYHYCSIRLKARAKALSLLLAPRITDTAKAIMGARDAPEAMSWDERTYYDVMMMMPDNGAHYGYYIKWLYERLAKGENKRDRGVGYGKSELMDDGVDDGAMNALSHPNSGLHYPVSRTN